jgi:NAD(P)-dependent dehydrogenase (short-subunit alcohol dehydrogenase family)
MGICEGRVVIVTGAGAGIGREHALLFAKEGAKVIVNDIGVSRTGEGGSTGPAQEVVNEIVSNGGEAVASTVDISDFDGAESLIRQAVDTFGDLHVLVNNAGILRDRMMATMGEAEWDAVIRVHLKGTFAPSHHAAAYWRDQSKSGKSVDARIINTSSSSGVFGNIGQCNYGAAKAGIAAFTIISAMELQRYGVTVNAICPTAVTRMTEDLAMVQDLQKQLGDLGPENIAPMVVWLGSSLSVEITGRLFSVRGNRVTVLEGWTNGPVIEHKGTWQPAELSAVLPDLVRDAAPNSLMNGTRPVA